MSNNRFLSNIFSSIILKVLTDLAIEPSSIFPNMKSSIIPTLITIYADCLLRLNISCIFNLGMWLVIFYIAMAHVFCSLVCIFIRKLTNSAISRKDRFIIPILAVIFETTIYASKLFLLHLRTYDSLGIFLVANTFSIIPYFTGGYLGLLITEGRR